MENRQESDTFTKYEHIAIWGLILCSLKMIPAKPSVLLKPAI